MSYKAPSNSFQGMVHDANWNDMIGATAQGVGASSLTATAWGDSRWKAMTFTNNTDVISMVYQMPHGWALNSDVRVHLHHTEVAAGTVVFDYEYFWVSRNQAIPLTVAGNWTTGTTSITVAAGDVGKHLIDTLFNVTGLSGKAVSDCLLVSIKRNASTTVVPYVLFVDAHVQYVSAGTVTEYGV